MEIGIIGAGGIGQALASHLVRADISVILSNSRNPASLAPVVEQLGPRARAARREEAARADIVVLAVRWLQLEQALAGLPPWNGRIVIDTTNPIVSEDFCAADLGGRTSSEAVTDLVPGARLVKAFNTLPIDVLGAAPQEGGGRRVIFLSGNDQSANDTVAALISRLGFYGVNLGPLSSGGALQQFPGGPLPALNLLALNR